MSKKNYVLKTQPHVCGGCNIKTEYAYREKYLDGEYEATDRIMWYNDAKTEEAFMKQMNTWNKESIKRKQGVLYIPIYVCE